MALQHFWNNERDRLKQADYNGRGGGDGYKFSPRLKAETGLKNEQRRLCAIRSNLTLGTPFGSPIGGPDSNRSHVKTSAGFRTSLFRSLLRGLRAFRVEKIVKNLALLDRLQNFAEFLHGLGPLQTYGGAKGTAAMRT
jgi:hypothetical protein